jgi:hypothetical protein
MAPLTARFDDAVAYALEAHRTQPRKGGDAPYAAHLLAVASLVLEAGGDEDTAIVALLHDVVEDQGGAERLDDVRQRFGNVIADAVLECSAEAKTDTVEWLPRKQRYIAAMSSASPLALRVSIADKLHNLRSTLADYRAHGDALLSRFNAPDADALRWYYEELADVYADRLGRADPLVAELRRTLGQLTLLMQRSDCPACQAGDVVPVAMGLPTADDMAWAEAGNVAIGGCVVGPETPHWMCQVCGHSWRDESLERSW